jgi:uncharacterized protein YdeI (YjbR/CyaY-like superfamily)
LKQLTALPAWLEKHGGTKAELIVGYYKLGSPGWIDGVRKRIDEHAYQIRFTPRKPTSIWSRINIERVRVLSREGRMREAGLKALPGYRRLVIWKIVSPKRAETRERRLQDLIQASKEKRRI